jgi:hypothetical protein
MHKSVMHSSKKKSHRVPRKKSKRLFSNTAAPTPSPHSGRPMRGGIRL